jgi:hypothetical protein
MKSFVTRRAAALTTAAVFAVITACSDSGSTQPNLSGPNASASNGANGSRDTAKTGGTRDSSGSHNPAPTPVQKFALLVQVGAQTPGAADTLTTDPLPGSTVTVYEQTTTFTHVPGADTVHFENTLVATGSTDASGRVVFPNLKGTSQYLVKAEPPLGSTRHATNALFYQAFADTVRIFMVLR